VVTTDQEWHDLHRRLSEHRNRQDITEPLFIQQSSHECHDLIQTDSGKLSKQNTTRRNIVKHGLRRLFSRLMDEHAEDINSSYEIYQKYMN